MLEPETFLILYYLGILCRRNTNIVKTNRGKKSSNLIFNFNNCSEKYFQNIMKPHFFSHCEYKNDSFFFLCEVGQHFHESSKYK